MSGLGLLLTYELLCFRLVYRLSKLIVSASCALVIVCLFGSDCPGRWLLKCLLLVRVISSSELSSLLNYTTLTGLYCADSSMLSVF